MVQVDSTSKFILIIELSRVLKELQLLGKGGDNASNNNTMLDTGELDYLPPDHIAGPVIQCRCCGHTLNVVNRGVFGLFVPTGKKKITLEDDHGDPDDDVENQDPFSKDDEEEDGPADGEEDDDEEVILDEINTAVLEMYDEEINELMEKIEEAERASDKDLAVGKRALRKVSFIYHLSIIHLTFIYL